MNESEGPFRVLALLEMEHHEHAKTRRRLAKAEHDCERYARRIRFLQARHEILVRQFHAVQKERDMLTNCVNTLERMLFHEPGTETRSEESAERTAQAETAAVSADDQGTAHGRAGQERHYDKRP